MIEIDGKSLSIEDVYAVAVEGDRLSINDETLKSIEEKHRSFIQLINSDRTVYGVNTGFGSLLNVRIQRDQEIELQKNLIRSHSSGVGQYLDLKYVRAIMVVRLNSLAVGYSAVSPDLLKMIMDMLNKDVIPAVPKYGSVGASGDLAPLAHIGLAMMGEGKAFYEGRLMDSSKALEKAGLKPYEFKEKEGVALINGTSFMAGILSIALMDAHDTLENALRSALLSFEALNGTSKAFTPWILGARPHLGQVAIGNRFREYLKGSEIVERSDRTKVQDAYTLRCIPQVYGSVADVLDFAENILSVEINSATDNPLFNGDEVVSGGNFHGEPVALIADFLSIALTDLGNMIERRLARLVDTNLSGLPPFLTKNSGLNSGYMIPQYTAAALCNRNKVLSYPSSADTIPTSANQEDHVSMGANGSLKLLEILDNVRYIIAIEYLLGSQALEFTDKRMSPSTRKIYDKIREKIKPLDADRPASFDIEEIKRMMEKGEFISVLQ
ncbi:histidine ammonia-lyase [Thermoplasma sp.]|uniref:histidine ammonia-lyase n=1 Tax=Thermoplasma sp. TaxID=1973142 RepID=UPI00262FDC1C|nr:histidine ammonia-lyase [Thermoplasma sp.]